MENLPTAAMSERLYSVFEFGGSEELFQDFFFGCAVAKIEGHIGDCCLLYISNLKARWCRGWHSEQEVHLLSLPMWVFSGCSGCLNEVSWQF